MEDCRDAMFCVSRRMGNHRKLNDLHDGRREASRLYDVKSKYDEKKEIHTKCRYI